MRLDVLSPKWMFPFSRLARRRFNSMLIQMTMGSLICRRLGESGIYHHFLFQLVTTPITYFSQAFSYW